MVDAHFVGTSNGDEGSYRCHAGYGCKGFLVINALYLGKSFCYEAGLIPCYFAVFIVLESSRPFAFDNFLVRLGAGYKGPGVVAHEGVVFVLRCLGPVGVGHSLSNVGRDLWLLCEVGLTRVTQKGFSINAKE